MRGHVASVAIGLVLAACSAAATPNPTPTPTPTTPTPTPTPTATFADPAVGIVAVRIDIVTDLGGLVPTLTVYEDGRVLRLVGETDQLGVRHVTHAGVEAIRRELFDSGFFEGDAVFRSPASWPAGFTNYVAIVRSGDRTVTVGATNIPGTGAEAFIALLERVVPLETWLPDETWLDLHPEPYIARHSWLLTDSSPGVLATYPEPPVFTAAIDDVAPRLPIAIHEFGAPVPRFAQDFPRYRCGVIDAPTAAQVVTVLRLAGYEVPPPGFSLSGFEFAWRATNGIFWLYLQPLLPDTPVSCESVTWAF